MTKKNAYKKITTLHITSTYNSPAETWTHLKAIGPFGLLFPYPSPHFLLSYAQLSPPDISLFYLYLLFSILS